MIGPNVTQTSQNGGIAASRAARTCDKSGGRPNLLMPKH